jgi:hypothetical protein
LIRLTPVLVKSPKLTSNCASWANALPTVATEMALHVLAYNLTRVMNIVGIKPFLAAIRV